MKGETEKALPAAKLESISACKNDSSAQLKFIILYGSRSADQAREPGEGEEIPAVQEGQRKRGNSSVSQP